MTVGSALRAATGLVVLVGMLIRTEQARPAAGPINLDAARKPQWRQSSQLSSQARQLYRTGKRIEAIATVKQVLAINRTLFGDTHLAVAGPLRSLAAWQEAEDDFVEAVRARKEIVRIQERFYGTNDWRSTDARWDLVTTERLQRGGAAKRDGVRKARRLHVQALRIFEQGKLLEALPLVRQARDLLSASLGKDHPEYAACLHTIGLLTQRMGKHQRALPLLEKAREMLGVSLGERHPQSIAALISLGRLYKDMGAYEKALPACARADTLMKANGQQQQPRYAVNLTDLAELHLRRGGHERALRLAERAVEATRATFGEKKREYATSLQALANVYRVLGEHRKELLVEEKAHQVLKAALGDTHVAYVTNLGRLSRRYKEAGDYRRALELSEEARQKTKAIVGEKHRFYATSLRRLAEIYQAMGNHKRALSLYEQIRDLFKTTVGEEHDNYATSLNDLARFHQSIGELEKARKLYERLRRLIGRTHGEKSPTYATWTSYLAGVLSDMGEYARAETLYEQARALLAATVGETHPTYAGNLNNLASLYQRTGNLGAAVALTRQALHAVEAARGKNHPGNALIMKNLAWLYLSSGDYARALSLYERVRDVRKAVLGPRHPRYADSVCDLARLYQELGNYDKARALYAQARDLRKTTLGEKHIDYAHCLHSLGLIAKETGDYGTARRLYEQVRELLEATGKQKHEVYATTLSSLAGVYQSVGDDEKAQALQERACRIYELAVGRKNTVYSSSLLKLATIYHRRGSHAKGLALQEQACELLKASVGTMHPNHARSLASLGVWQAGTGDRAKGLALLEQARKVLAATLGRKHPDHARCLLYLAVVHRGAGKHKEAISLAEEARDLLASGIGEKHPDYAACLQNLALTHYLAGDFKIAEQMYHKALVLLQQHLEDTFAILSERQRLDMVARLRYASSVYASIALRASVPATRLYERVLAWKGIVAQRDAEERLSHDLPSLRPLLDQLRLVRSSLAALAAQAPSPAGQKSWRARFDALETRKEKLELELANASKRVGRRHATPGQIAQALPRGDVLVDFLAYDDWQPYQASREVYIREERLLAFVLAKGRAPVCVPLGSASRIDWLIQTWRAALTINPTASSDVSGQELRKLVWLPVAKHIRSGESIVAAPDGPVCSLPLAALPGSKAGSYLIEEHAIAYATSGQQLLDLAAVQPGGSEGLLLAGGLSYGSPVGKQSADVLQPRLPLARSLPGTRLEMERIDRLFRVSFPRVRAPLLLTGAKADKATLLAALNPGKKRWRYVHLATHGYFEPPRTAVPTSALAALAVGAASARRAAGALQAVAVLLAGEEPGAVDRDAGLLDLSGQRHRTLGRNPLLLSGLVLSGANSDPKTGLLSAEEVARLDLRGCDLVVLSACDTGLGKVADGEGVLGLQRAFQSAGARATVCSLWSISDAATSVLMEHFYTNLWSRKMTRLEALRQAQLFVLRNPSAVEARRLVLRGEARKRGLVDAPGEWRKLEPEASPLPFGGKKEKAKPATRSGPAFWAGFVLFGDGR